MFNADGRMPQRSSSFAAVPYRVTRKGKRFPSYVSNHLVLLLQEPVPARRCNHNEESPVTQILHAGFPIAATAKPHPFRNIDVILPNEFDIDFMRILVFRDFASNVIKIPVTDVTDSKLLNEACH